MTREDKIKQPRAMKIRRIYTGISKSNETNDWQFLFTPALWVRRDDVFSDEAAYYIGFSFLLFQAYILVTKKKQTT